MSKHPPVHLLRFLLITVGVIAVLYLGRAFLIPFAFGGLLAMIFSPLVQRLQRRGIPRVGGIVISVLILVLIGGSIFLFTFMQTRALVQDWPKIQEELAKQRETVEDFVLTNAGIDAEERIKDWRTQLSNQTGQISSLVTDFFGSFFSLLGGILLTLVYMVILLLEEQRLYNFMLYVADNGATEAARSAMRGSRRVTSQYLFGRLILVTMLGFFYSIGFYLFGLQYAFSVAILAAMLSLIPYLGNLIGGGIALLIAVATGGDYTMLLGVIGTMGMAQFLENNILTPWIMGDRIALNPLATIVGVIAFSILWGVAGTILAIPILGILKVIFDQVETLRPYGYLLSMEESNDSASK